MLRPAAAVAPEAGDDVARHPRRRPLWLALALPELALESLATDAGGSPIAVIEPHGHRARVIAVDAAAAAGGVVPGETAARAGGCCPGLRLVERDPDAERAALDMLAGCMGRYSPLVSVIEDGGLVLEVGASLALFGGLRRLRAALGADLARLGFTFRDGVAPTPLAAWWRARAGLGEALFDTRQLRSGLAAVPIGCTGIAAADVERLAAIGVDTIGECLRLPRDGLARRLGPRLLETFDRALGRRPDPRPAHRPPEHFERLLPMSVPTADREVLLAGAARLLTELGVWLRARMLGALGFELHLVHRTGHATRITIGLVAASHDPRHFIDLLRVRSEYLTLPAPVDRIGLRDAGIAALAPREIGLFEAAEPPSEALPALIERLSARLGRAAVHGLAVVPDHRPERAWRALPAPSIARRHVRGDGEGVAPAAAPRPLWLAETPRTLTAAAGTPLVDGTRLRLLRGPERIESGWWEAGGDVARDYYEAAGGDGARYWIYRERRGARGWCLHGLFG